MSIGILTLTFRLPYCHSLKEKRSQIKPIFTRLRREFNISLTEMDYHDEWQTCQMLIACASAEKVGAERLLQQVVAYFESHWPDLVIIREDKEILI